MPRASGVLLHPTSLPGPCGIGDLGPESYRFVDMLAAAGQTYWQALPLGPTGYGDSPYQTFSAFAGNPLLVSPEILVDEGLLPAAVLDAVPGFPDDRVDYGPVITWKKRVLREAFTCFDKHATPGQRSAFDQFSATHSTWLSDFTLFMALKDAHDGAPWPAWPRDIAARKPQAVARWRGQLDREIRLHAFHQHLFFRQWSALKAYAASRGVRMIGDAPIFVAHDSADCWIHRDLFYLTPDGAPALVAGVPPDYFSATGQLWGNPLYRWEAHAAAGYAWWVDRLRMAFSLVDLLRLDHFRGFAGYWAIPASAPTAETGDWRPGPGPAFFEAVEQALGAPLPIIAEDLGVITPDVEEMRDRFGFPGMRILQFAFGGAADNRDLPHNYSRNCIVYTGTHDNDTTAGWFAAAAPQERAHALAYLASDGADPAWDLARLAFASVAKTAIVPLQDLLGLGSTARMNRPGQPGGNWRWRYTAGAITAELIARMREMSRLYGRSPSPPAEPAGARSSGA